MENFYQGNTRVYTGNSGTIIRCIYEKEDVEIRLNICGVLQFIKDRVKDLDVNFIAHRDKKWGYPRLNEKETYELLRDEGI